MELPKDSRYLKYPGFDPWWVAYNCSRCSVCKWVDSWRVKSWKYARICPQHKRYLFDAYSGQGKCDLALAILEGRLGIGDDPVIKDILFRCPMCGGCDAMDKGIRDGELIKLFKWLRQKYVKELGPIPEHRALLDSVRNYGNVWFQPRSRRGLWAKGLGVKDLSKERAEVVLFVGCTYGLSQELEETIQAIGKVLKGCGVDFGILGEREVCCGSPLEKIGAEEEFLRVASQNVEVLNSLKAEVVLTPCAGCYATIGLEYSERELKKRFKVLHVVEYLEELYNSGSLKFRKELPLKVTWHDPCHMGRLSRPYVPGKEIEGVYEAPRNLLKGIPGVELYEMERIKEYAWCCGGGGGVFTGFKDFAQWTALERLEEAKDTGAQVIVTSCPWCESNLGNAIKGMEEKMGLKNLFQLIATVME